jgi:hypothetical protein
LTEFDPIELIASHGWIYARAMPEIEHHQVVRGKSCEPAA